MTSFFMTTSRVANDRNFSGFNPLGRHQPQNAAGSNTGHNTHMAAVVAASMSAPADKSRYVTSANTPPPMKTMTANAASCRHVHPNMGFASYAAISLNTFISKATTAPTHPRQVFLPARWL